MKTGKPQLMREINLGQIREILQQGKSLTKTELANLSGLSVVTINALIRQLIENGEVCQQKGNSATGGRPASLFRYNFDYQLVLAICLFQKERTDMAEFSVCNIAGEIKAQWQVTFQEVTKEDFAELILGTKSTYPSLQQVAIGIPGVEVGGQIKMSDFQSMRGAYLRRYLTDISGLPVTIENDVNSVLLGYCHQQELQSETVVALYYPDNYPPGSAVYLHGKIFRGANGLVGEISQLPLLANWQKVENEENRLNENIIQTIATMLIVYDPHRIIIYGKRPKTELLPMIQKN